MSVAHPFTARLAARPWRLIRDPPAGGAWNMAVDAALYATAREGGLPALRFYSWEPACLSLGRFQAAARGIDWESLRARGWEAARRPTGGQGVLHHLELTYAIALPPDMLGGAGLRESYAVLAGGLVGALGRVCGGVDVWMCGRMDGRTGGRAERGAPPSAEPLG